VTSLQTIFHLCEERLILKMRSFHY